MKELPGVSQKLTDLQVGLQLVELLHLSRTEEHLITLMEQ